MTNIFRSIKRMSARSTNPVDPIAVALRERSDQVDLTSLGLSELPDSVGQLTTVKELYLSGNKLTALPDSIRKLKELRVLHLDNNLLEILPDAIGDLTKLEILDLRNNRLTQLPVCLGELVQLRSLYVANNQLKALPESLGFLAQLQRLDLSGNQLADLPTSFLSLSSLSKLLLHGNNDLGIPAEVLGPTSDDFGLGKASVKASKILEYYYRLNEGRRPLNEAKLILVGRGGVGKTSIVNQLVTGVFKDEKKTEGIKITEWKITPGADEVRLNVWDFGGQEIMHATHQFFMTQRSLYLLVLNGREGGEDADAEYWLKLITSFGGDSPVIVVLNKIREHAFDVNRPALQQKHSVREFIKTDCEDGTGIQDLRRAIERETDRLADVRKAFPARWFAIKNHLAAMKENFLSFDQYREICAKLGETDETAQEHLAGFLHTLGIVLNYRDDPRLHDTHVLSPHWVTSGIYRILNSRILETGKGEIHLDEIPQILNISEYPISMHRFLFDLMKKFDLCFSFPDDDTHYLIPELLDKQESAQAADFNSKESLCFQYHYPVLPEGLLPRFIVRTHVLSEHQPRWRTGVIIQFEGCRALIKADVLDRKIFILVLGQLSSRRRLLAVIRSDFERIHRDIKNLKPQEMVPIPEYPDFAVSYEKLLAMEQEGIRTFFEFVGEKLIELNVSDLLNGVDQQGPRNRNKQQEKKNKARVFISYSHKDEDLRNELEAHLKILQRIGLIEVWHDRKIEAGEDWRFTIHSGLERADIVLLLVSRDFLASDYCFEVEAKYALERAKNGEVKIIPVILRPCRWQIAEFAHLQALPRDGLPVVKWSDKDSAWLDVEEGIERIAASITGSRNR